LVVWGQWANKPKLDWKADRWDSAVMPRRVASRRVKDVNTVTTKLLHFLGFIEQCSFILGTKIGRINTDSTPDAKWSYQPRQEWN
jgi:hypothetical protein